mgnify:CR=1 FL=1
MRGVFDLNCDVGESFGAWVMGNDAEVMRHVTSANIACGVHASDPGVMRRTAWLCKQYGVMAGAHPGYPDLQGFGRRRMDMERGEIIDWVIYQVGALRGFTSLAGIPLRHVKLHGALYNRVSQEEELLLDIAGAVRGAFGDVVFVTLASPASGELKQRFRSSGVRVALEAFPDRAYTEEGALVARGHEGAVIKDARIIASRLASTPVAFRRVIPGAAGAVRPWTSTSRIRVPSPADKMTLPGRWEYPRWRKSPAGSVISMSPLSLISKIPSSLVAPKRFFAARMSR